MRGGLLREDGLDAGARCGLLRLGADASGKEGESGEASRSCHACRRG